LYSEGDFESYEEGRKEERKGKERKGKGSRGEGGHNHLIKR
jgi:hypothetical protein